MGISEDITLSLAGKAYDAALDEKKWASFLEAFARAVGGGSAMMRSVDLRARKAGFVASVGYDPAWQAAYCSHFVKLDYLTAAMNRFKVGEARTSDQVSSLSKQRKTEYFNDYSLPQDKPHALGVVLARNDSHLLQFGAQRGKRAGEFGSKQVALMNALAPHVARAVQVHRRLSSASVEKKWALGALDQLRMGVILTNGAGKPLFVNHAAGLMMAANKGIRVCRDRLVLDNPSENALLHRLIAGAAHEFNGSAASGGDMRISLPNEIEHLQCMVAPVSPELSPCPDSAPGCVAIFLSEPGSLQLSPKRLAVLYGLSPAESRLAAELAAFNSLEKAAGELGIAIGTARTQLAAAFAKTGARTQAELLMLLATGTLANFRKQ